MAGNGISKVCCRYVDAVVVTGAAVVVFIGMSGGRLAIKSFAISAMSGGSPMSGKLFSV